MVYYLGYKCPFTSFPRMTFLDGDPLQVKVVNPTPELRHAIAVHSRSQALIGAPISSEHVPTTLMWESQHPMPDFEGPLGFLCVSPAMKDMIEGFEPGVHQFFPLKVVNKKKEEIAQRFLWVVCTNLDSVDREHTTYYLRRGISWRADGIENAKLFYSSRQTAGHHFWRDTRIRGAGLYASDEAGAVMVNAGFVGFAASRQEHTI